MGHVETERTTVNTFEDAATTVMRHKDPERKTGRMILIRVKRNKRQTEVGREVKKWESRDYRVNLIKSDNR